MSDDPSHDDSDVDVVALFDNLRRRGEKRELVASKRPSASELAVLLHKLADLIYHGFETERVGACEKKGLGTRKTHSWLPAPGSQAESDAVFVDALLDAFVRDHDLRSLEFAHTNPLRNSIVWGIGLMNQALNTAIDHLHGIADSLESGRTIRAPLTLSRTVLEAAATGYFLSDPTVDSRERLRRSHNLRMEDLKEGANHRTGDGDADYLVGLEELVAFASASNFNVRPPRMEHSPPVIPSPAGAKEAIRFLIERMLPGVGLATYRMLSNVAHCRPNVGDVLPDDYSLSHEVDGWRKAEKIAWYTIPALLAVRQMITRVADYLGWEDYEIGDLIEETIGIISAGAGWKDALIREQLGLPPES